MRWSGTVVEVERLRAAVGAHCPAGQGDRLRWYVVSAGRLLGVDLEDGSMFFELELPGALDGDLLVEASASGRWVAVVAALGLEGVLVDTHSRQVRTLRREDYHANVSTWAIAFAQHAGAEVLIHATTWNRLEAHALPAFTRIAPEADQTDVDYFWGASSTSASGRKVASFGWCWHPLGLVQTFDVAAWLSTRAQFPTLPTGLQADWWDGQLCWLDDDRLALFGAQTTEDDTYMATQAGLVIVTAAGAPVRYFDGLLGRQLASDGARLFVLDDAHTHLVDLDTYAVTREVGPQFDAWHPGARAFLTLPTPEAPGRFMVTRLGATVEAPGVEPGPHFTPAAAAVLADALEERALAPEAVAHLRAGEPHGTHCWVFEALRHGDTVR